MYIKVLNEKKYSSFVYETIVNIDTEKPNIFYKLTDKIEIIANDNLGLSSIQCSIDGYNYTDNYVNGKNVYLIKDDLCKYVRAVDKAGNISELKKITD